MTVDELIYKWNTVEFVPKMTILARERPQICLCYDSEIQRDKAKRPHEVRMMVPLAIPPPLAYA